VGLRDVACRLMRWPAGEWWSAEALSGGVDRGEAGSRGGDAGSGIGSGKLLAATSQWHSRALQAEIQNAGCVSGQLFQDFLANPGLCDDIFGNYVVQKLLQYANALQIKQAFDALKARDLGRLSRHQFGCRVVQALVDRLDKDDIVLFCAFVKGQIPELTAHPSANHVLQRLLPKMPQLQLQAVVTELRGKVVELGCDLHGCRVLQRMVETCKGDVLSPMLDEVLENAEELCESQNGNFVVQFVWLFERRRKDRACLMSLFESRLAHLSCNKYGSNVVERAFTFGSGVEQERFVRAMVGSPADLDPPLVAAASHAYGNFVVRRMLEFSTGVARRALLHQMGRHPSLLAGPYGRFLLAAIEGTSK